MMIYLNRYLRKGRQRQEAARKKLEAHDDKTLNSRVAHGAELLSVNKMGAVGFLLRDLPRD